MKITLENVQIVSSENDDTTFNVLSENSTPIGNAYIYSDGGIEVNTSFYWLDVYDALSTYARELLGKSPYMFTR